MGYALFSLGKGFCPARFLLFDRRTKNSPPITIKRMATAPTAIPAIAPELRVEDELLLVEVLDPLEPDEEFEEPDDWVRIV